MRAAGIGVVLLGLSACTPSLPDALAREQRAAIHLVSEIEVKPHERLRLSMLIGDETVVFSWPNTHRGNVSGSVTVQYPEGELDRIYDYRDYYFVRDVAVEPAQKRAYVVVEGGSFFSLGGAVQQHVYVWDIEGRRSLGRYRLPTHGN
ncbi:hypothetical protein [Ferrimonas pelagia]|uniref:Uncharacterized protein n=1 Tax=Ferrimonas pelagia TaxID=1177826 RepID=A0ABP9FJE7_9GAMM